MGAFLYNFGMSQEDERTEAAALGLGPLSRVLSVCSAGEMPLSLLALGAREVKAIDIDPHQLHLAHLKRAVVLTLSREQAVRFLGYLPASPQKRQVDFSVACEALPLAARDFWRAHPTELEAGVIWAGRYERYVRRLTRWAGYVLGRRLEGLFAARSLSEQTAHFDRAFDNRLFRGLFAVAFHPRVFTKRGMDPRSLQHRASTESLGQQYFRRFRQLCTATPVQENYLLQLHLLGRVESLAAVPAYLSETGFVQARENMDRLSMERGDLVSVLGEIPSGHFDAFHFSNLPDWMPPEGFNTVMELLADKSARPGRAVWRFIHVDRQIPKTLRSRVVIDHAAALKLNRADRFPFYTVVPAVVGG